MRVCINPTYNYSDQTEGGIRRVVDAMLRYLPKFDIEPVTSPDGADLIVNHGTFNVHRPGVPTIAACHGLYWTGYKWDAWAFEANKEVIENLRTANAITVPSNWVGHAVSRGLWRPTHTVYHGVEASEWEPRGNRGYVLWNKARTDAVSNHLELDQLTELMPNESFVSTYGTQRTNTRIIGVQNHETMRKLVQHAEVFLAMPRETFGIGTIEALACGVPVAGWRYGGQEEIVVHGQTGYLAEYGDYEALAECVQLCKHERKRLSANARADVLQRWGWEDKIEEYAKLYQGVVEGYTTRRPRVSVVITCYNLANYVQQAMRSVDGQGLDAEDLECIVVDDYSTDNSLQLATHTAEFYKSRGQGTNYFKVARTPRNLGLSEARNYGASLATGKYLIYLDADDMLAPGALITMADHLDRHPELDITFGHLDTVNEAGEQRTHNPWPDGTFSFAKQMAHLNQLQYSAMMRRRVWENLGGYRARDWRAEDASFWCRAASFGYHIGCATQDATLIYRMRSESKGSTERRNHTDVDGDWTSWFPWRLGAVSGAVGTSLMDQTPKPVLNTALVPFGAQGDVPRGAKIWDVPHHQSPAVSIIIPVGPDHVQWLQDALDSVMAQTCPSWEVVVVFDNSQPLPTQTYPWARFTYSTGGIIPPYEALGAGAARNVGLRHARAPLVLFLDGDDVLRPETLEKMFSQYAAQGGYIYCDTLAVTGDARIADVATQDWRNLPTLERGSSVQASSIIPAPDWDQKEFLQSGYGGRPGCHSVTALVATVDALGVGGFDEKMRALEDWEFFLRLAASGITGHLIAEPLLLYRLDTGTRRANRHEWQQELETLIRSRYEGFITGERPMCSCGSGGGGPQAQKRAAAAIAEMLPSEDDTLYQVLGTDYVQTAPALAQEGRRIRLKYIGDHYGAITYKGQISRETYRAGLDPAFDAIDVDPRDVEHLMLSSAFRVIGAV